jgi:riboflavin kinase/FMN adenylyltransferase
MKIKGTVIRGKMKGRNLGFPTANIIYADDLPSGVYTGKVYVRGNGYKAAIFYGDDKKILEAHLLDFSGDLYDQEIEIEVGKKIREVKKFDTEDELKKQIAKDIEQIKKDISR